MRLFQSNITNLIFNFFFLLTLLLISHTNLYRLTSVDLSFSLPLGEKKYNPIEKNTLDSPGSFSSSRVEFLNDRARDITGATVLNIPGFASPAGLTGEGQLVAIADSGLDVGSINDIHPDLKNTPDKAMKVAFLESIAGRQVPDDPTGHGTHMAATIAGTGSASGGKFKGVAPGSRLYFQAILNANGEPAPPAELADLFTPAYQAGARIHVDGWGGGANLYGSPAVQIDTFVRQQPDFLPIFGAGNSGPSPNTLTTEANSKNALIVGASVLPRPALQVNDSQTVADFSSCGPSGDGRIKPELLAPATTVISARSRLIEGNLPSYPQYTHMQGTSMATAVAGGSAALLREYFTKMGGIATPSAALLRASLANGARPAAGGNSTGGFGVIDLASTILALKDGTFQRADDLSGLAQGEQASYTFNVTDPTAPFKATLAWTDPAAAPGSGSALVNDLDLVVQSPNGVVYYGNHFLGENVPDRTNNIEQIYLPSPLPGLYTVQVIAKTVRQNAQNSLHGANKADQDYGLVWGQPPARDRLLSSSGDILFLAGGGQVSLSQTNTATPVFNAVNDDLYPSDQAHLYPGAATYHTPQHIYLATSLWQSSGIGVFKSTRGAVFGEMNRAIRLGGYYLGPDVKIFVNGRPATVDDLPPGLEVTASINPTNQTIWRVNADYDGREGRISSVSSKDGRKIINLYGDSRQYNISKSAAILFEDKYVNIETLDAPFGTGIMSELEEILPGMPVSLHLSPSNGEVQYIAVNRLVALDMVKEVDTESSEIKTSSGLSILLSPNALLKRDEKPTVSLGSLKPGDHVMALLLPDSNEAISLVAHSTVNYGKVIYCSDQSKTLYLLDDTNHYKSFSLQPNVVVYRLGKQAGVDAISAGSRVRLLVDPADNAVRRIDVADTFNKAGKEFTGYDRNTNMILMSDGFRYRLSSTSRFYKNGYPVLPENLLPGEGVNLECVSAPLPTGPVIVSANAFSNAQSPYLSASTLLMKGQLLVTGQCDADSSLYVFNADGTCAAIPSVRNGRFFYETPLPDVNNNLTIVAINQRNGGIAGQSVIISSKEETTGTSAGHEAVTRAIFQNRTGTSNTIDSAGFQPEAPFSRVNAVAALAKLLNWSPAGEWPIWFTDVENIPVMDRTSVAKARYYGMIAGYPDGTFRPGESLSRAEAAVLLKRAMYHLGLNDQNSVMTELSAVRNLSALDDLLSRTSVKGSDEELPDDGLNVPVKSLPYIDAVGIPSWATEAVAETTNAGIFQGRPNGIFSPNEPVSAGEMAILMDRLLAACERLWVNR